VTERNTWIIGASAGIGAALARELAGRGDAVAISARNENALRDVQKTLGGAADHRIIPLDVSDYDAVIRAHGVLRAAWGWIDRVIFMAGLYTPMKTGQIDIADMRRIIDVNLNGAFYVTEAVLPGLLAQKTEQKPQLVLCASVAGWRGLPNSQPYGATKAGVINLAESLHVEHSKKIDVRVINPGFVETRLTDKNDFAMPMRISPEQAARHIADGLSGHAFDIHFPKKFTWAVRLLRLFPDGLYFKIASRL
jgi:short-subunit dehydrogenase